LHYEYIIQYSQLSSLGFYRDDVYLVVEHLPLNNMKKHLINKEFLIKLAKEYNLAVCFTPDIEKPGQIKYQEGLIELKDPYDIDEYQHGETKYFIREILKREVTLEDVMLHTLLHEIAHYVLEHDIKANKKILDEFITNHNFSLSEIMIYSRKGDKKILKEIKKVISAGKYQKKFKEYANSFDQEEEANFWAYNKIRKLKETRQWI
jgi:hypothetical protein